MPNVITVSDSETIVFIRVKEGRRCGLKNVGGWVSFFHVKEDGKFLLADPKSERMKIIVVGFVNLSEDKLTGTNDAGRRMICG